MARALRIEYAGAVYHAMARGNQGRAIFQDDQDRSCFLETLGEACEKMGPISRVSQAIGVAKRRPARKLEQLKRKLMRSEQRHK
jgi:hypothetical protein